MISMTNKTVALGVLMSIKEKKNKI